MVRKGFVVAAIQLLCHLPAAAQLFEDPVLYPTQPQPRKVRLADLDGLPDIDLITANASGGLSLLVNGSFGVYLPPVYVGVFGSEAVEDVAAADLDGDLDVDLVAVTKLRVVFLRNDGDLEFTESDFHEPGAGFLIRVETADLDGDEDQDVILCSEGLQGGVRVMENAGDGTFSASTLIFGPASVSDVVVTDLDDDTILDVAATWLGQVVVMMGRGDGTFDDPVLYPTQSVSLVSVSAGLMNDDAFADLVTLARDINSTGHNLIWTNNGDGTFGEPIDSSSDYLARKTVVADIDQQLCPDLVTSTGHQIASYWLNGCDGGWSYGWVTRAATPVQIDIAAVDVDSDTDLDVVLLWEDLDGVAVYENTVIESQGIFRDRFETGDTSMWSSTVS